MKNLKNYFTIIMAVLALSLAACSSDSDKGGDDEPDDSIESMIIGTWKYVDDLPTFEETYTFYKNGTLEYVYETKYDSEEEYATYKIYGNKLLMTFGDEVEQLTIISISKDEIKVNWDGDIENWYRVK